MVPHVRCRNELMASAQIVLVISLRGAVAWSKSYQAGSLAHVKNCMCLTSSELRVLCIATGQSPGSGRCACKVRRFTNKTPYKAFSQVKSRNVSPLRHSILPVQYKTCAPANPSPSCRFAHPPPCMLPMPGPVYSALSACR